MPEKRQAPILRFGVFEINFSAHELRKHGIRVRLPGQPFAILAILLERPGEVVTREEMQERLWASDTFVDFEHSLNSAIKKLRAALNDSPENSRYIETVPRVGYRFVAPAQELSRDVVPHNDSNDRIKSPGALQAEENPDAGRGKRNRTAVAVAIGATLATLLTAATIYRIGPLLRPG